MGEMQMQYSRRQFLRTAAVGTLAASLGNIAQGAKKKRPNVVLFMVDDMGFSDIGCYGGEVKTPNIDKLASGGMQFTQFYNCAKCSPTRASILTGQYNQIVGTNSMENGATLGEALRPAGYRTIAVGKWHQKPLPTDRGFDRYYGLADGCCNFWNPGTVARPGEPAPGRKKTTPRRWAIEDKVIMGYVPEDKNFYSTDAFTDYAVDRLDEYKGENKPFLLYFPFTAPHYPLHAWPEDIAKYRGKYKVGWDEIRKKRYQKQIEIGLIDPKRAKLSPRDENVPAWDSLSKKEQDASDLSMAVYAAMIDRVDQCIGRVIAKLKQLGEQDNTLIMFLTDNGGCAETPDKTPDIPPGPVGGYRALGPAWANASNTPYRKYKSSDYEGGAHTPFIAYWPNVIKPGSRTDQVGHIIDILPTLMEVGGASYPEKIGDRNILPIDGKSLLTVFKGKKRKPHDVLYWQFSKAKAARKGKWKIVKFGDADWELYDIENDQTELNNLAAKHPEKKEELVKLYEDWTKRFNEKSPSFVY
jgi:arylsulfatase